MPNRRPSFQDKKDFLGRFLDDPQTYPDVFKSWIAGFLQQNPNVVWDTSQLPRLDKTKLFNVSGQATSSSAGTNINAGVTAICPVTVKLSGTGAVLVTWTGGQIKNTSGVTQSNFRSRIYAAGTLKVDSWPFLGSAADSIANGSTLPLAPFASIITGLPAGDTQFDTRFNIGDGSSSIQFLGNTISGVLSVCEL